MLENSYVSYYTRRGWGQGVTRNGNLNYYYFHVAELLRGQNQPVDQVTAAAILKYAQKCTCPMCNFGPILVKFRAISIYLTSMESYFYMF